VRVVRIFSLKGSILTSTLLESWKDRGLETWKVGGAYGELNSPQPSEEVWKHAAGSRVSATPAVRHCDALCCHPSSPAPHPVPNKFGLPPGLSHASFCVVRVGLQVCKEERGYPAPMKVCKLGCVGLACKGGNMTPPAFFFWKMA